MESACCKVAVLSLAATPLLTVLKVQGIAEALTQLVQCD